MDSVRDFIAKRLEEQGLLFLGIVSLKEEGSFPRFARWLEQGKHAGMAFLERYTHVRQDPRQVFPGARSAIVFAMNYYQGDTLANVRNPPRPMIAQYARLKDYHKAMKLRGEKVAEEFTLQYGSESQPIHTQVCIDTAPLLERALAAKTSRGFIGKNTLYIHPQHGSFLLLGEIVVSCQLSSDDKQEVDPTTRSSEGGCGSCRRCEINCPTNALATPYQLDANRCLSYWTIEHRGTIPEEFWPWLKIYYFGCDICQLACPYNRLSKIPAIAPGEWTDLDVFVVATMSQGFYESTFGGTPLTRAKRHGLRRNALIAMAVQRDPRLTDALASITEADEVVLHETRQQIEKWMRNASSV